MLSLLSPDDCLAKDGAMSETSPRVVGQLASLEPQGTRSWSPRGWNHLAPYDPSHGGLAVATARLPAGGRAAGRGSGGTRGAGGGRGGKTKGKLPTGPGARKSKTALNELAKALTRSHTPRSTSQASKS